MVVEIGNNGRVTQSQKVLCSTMALFAGVLDGIKME